MEGREDALRLLDRCVELYKEPLRAADAERDHLLMLRTRVLVRSDGVV